MILGALLCVALGISRFLARYHLVVDGHSTVVAGASYADVNFWLPGYDLIVACWFAAASILGLAAALPRIRNWLLMRRSHWLAPFTALALLAVAAFAVPTGIEDLYVGPNQITLELPYLLRSIAGTRQAYQPPGTLGRRAGICGLRDAIDRCRFDEGMRRRCRTRASGIGARSNRNCSKSRAYGPTTRFTASTSIAMRSMAPSGRS